MSQQENIEQVASLITKLDTDRRLSKEVLTKLPEVVRGDENTDVVFHIEPDVTIPSLKKLGRLFENGEGLININKRIAHAEQQLVNVIGETVRISQSLGVNRLNPSWTSIDLMSSNVDGDTGNPLYSASVDGGLRFAPEADHQRRPEAKTAASVSKIGAWMTAKFTEKVISKARPSNYSGSTYVLAGLHTFLAKNRSSMEVTESRLVTRSYTTTETRIEKYGGYYKWQTQYIFNQTENTRDLHQKKIYVDAGERTVSYQKRHYYQTTEQFTKIIPTMSEPQEQSFNKDYVCIGQTFYLNSTQVLVGFEYWEEKPASFSADRKFMLCRCRDGKPVLDEVITQGKATGLGSGAKQKIRVDWNEPVLINAKEQLAIVILFDKQINLYGTHTYLDDDRTGHLMFTRDGYFWDKLTWGIYQQSTSANQINVASNLSNTALHLDDSQDLAYNLIVASFPTSQEIIMPNFDLVGGISTATVNLTAQMPLDNSANIEVMVKVNNEWQPLSVLNNNINLPPSSEAKLVLTGTENVMPLIDTENTEFTLFRPKTELTYLTKERSRPVENIVKVAMEIAGYDSRYHTVDCVLLVGDNHTEVRPTVTVSGSAVDNSTGTRRYEFSLPPGRENYRIKVTASTSNASYGFDISSLIEFH